MFSGAFRETPHLFHAQLSILLNSEIRICECSTSSCKNIMDRKHKTLSTTKKAITVLLSILAPMSKSDKIIEQNFRIKQDGYQQ